LIEREGAFSRSLWGLFSLELWQQTFHDQAGSWRSSEAAPNDEVVGRR
jgi:hypothetical protein